MKTTSKEILEKFNISPLDNKRLFRQYGVEFARAMDTQGSRKEACDNLLNLIERVITEGRWANVNTLVDIGFGWTRSRKIINLIEIGDSNGIFLLVRDYLLMRAQKLRDFSDKFDAIHAAVENGCSDPSGLQKLEAISAQKVADLVRINRARKLSTA